MRLSSLVIVCSLLLCCGAAAAIADTWTDYDDIGPTFLTYETTYPTLCKRHDLGLSVEGRHLWALQISDNVGVDEDEPEFKYVSTMHGDEIVGTKLLMMLADYLIDNYGTDPQCTNVVNNIDLWLVPLMNPDGYDQTYRTRYNAAGIDLNRDFPDFGEANSSVGRQPETANIMAWTALHSFVASANLHGGELVANYPYDNELTGSRHTPDEDLFIYMSETYTYLNPPMWNSSTYYHGITNGADWYIVYGGMQDWNYVFHNCNEVTMELGVTKQPAASTISTYWSYNRDSLLAYIETCLIGIRGVVTEAGTGIPLAATVTVAGNIKEVTTDPDVGDYHRMLLPGTYDLVFSAPGYDSVTVNDIVVGSGDATRVDVQLVPPVSLISPNGGEQFTTNMPAEVIWTGDPASQFQVQYTEGYDTQMTEDIFERTSLGTNYITGGDRPWEITSTDAHGGTRAASTKTSMMNNHVSWLKRTVDSAQVSFWYKVSSDSGDYFNFYIDGIRQLHVSGQGDWEYFIADLTGTQELKWEYTKDSSGSAGSNRVWVDDLQMINDYTTWVDVANPTAVGAMSATWFPSTTGTEYRVRVRPDYGGGLYGDWDTSDGDFTVVASYVDGDYDNDGDVDLADFADFQRCLGASAYTACGNAFEFMVDGTVNANDYYGFHEALEASGPDN